MVPCVYFQRLCLYLNIYYHLLRAVYSFFSRSFYFGALVNLISLLDQFGTRKLLSESLPIVEYYCSGIAIIFDEEEFFDFLISVGIFSKSSLVFCICFDILCIRIIRFAVYAYFCYRGGGVSLDLLFLLLQEVLLLEDVLV